MSTINHSLISQWLSTRASWLIPLVQFVLVSIAFAPMLYQADAYIFADDGDGLKNYFTLEGYIQQADSVSLFRYTQQHYPFGDYIYYTDNTPLLAVGLRSLGVQDHSALFLNWFIALGLVFSSFLCYLLLKRFLSFLPLIFLLSWMIPWLSPQMLRLSIGHMNLSLSWVFLLGLYLLVREWEERKGIGGIGEIRYAVALVGLMIGSAYIHLYYLLMLGVMVGWWYLWRAIFVWGQWKDMGLQMIKALAIPVVAIVIVWTGIQLTDGHYDLRKEQAGGYNWTGWNLNPDAQYTSYPFQTLPFPLETSQPMNSEWSSYLGSMLLYGIPILLLLTLMLPGRKGRLQRNLTQADNGKMVLLLFLTGLGCWFTALGEYAQLADSAIKFHNPLTPFFYVSLLTDKVSHFRCMARFNWMFFLGISFLFAYGFNQLLEAKNQRWTQMLVGLLLLLGCIDAVDMARYTSSSAQPNPLTNSSRLEPIQALLSGIALDDYQALLPYPYFHVGTEDFNLTIDPTTDWYQMIFQVASHSQLPIIGAVLSRSPVEQSRSVLNWVSGQEADTSLRHHLSNKPILVVYSRDDKDWVQIPQEGREPARSHFLLGKNMPERMGMTLLKQEGSLALYRWDWER